MKQNATHHDDGWLIKLLGETTRAHDDIEHVYRITSLSKPSVNHISTEG